MKITQPEASKIANKLSLTDYDFDWRSYAKICIIAGEHEKFRKESAKSKALSSAKDHFPTFIQNMY